MAVLKRITGDAMRDEFSFIIDQHHPRGAAFASHTNHFGCDHKLMTAPGLE